jgi:DNA-binding MarR family transcriptional regulator
MTQSNSADACALAAGDFVVAYTRFLVGEINSMDSSLRITPSKYRALAVLERTPGISVTDFAHELGIRTPTASVIVVRLTRDGLVHRTPAGGNRLALALTAKGSGLVAGARQHISDAFAEALNQSPESVLAQSTQALRTLQQILESLR